jgi:hypothetical protein
VDIERKRRPVFVMGCHRSGTNLLYDTLLSAGGFAVYRGYLPIYETLVPRFGSLENPRNRQKIIDTWMKSKGFRRAGVDAGPLSSELLAECRNGGDFIRIVMDKIAQSQGVQRWVVYDPDSVLHVARIRKDIPDPLFVHIIRDGRGAGDRAPCWRQLFTGTGWCTKAGNTDARFPRITSKSVTKNS